MNDKIPKLLRDSIEQNDYDVDIITKKLKLPWLKLDIKLDEPTQEDIKQMYSNADWREKWNYPTLKEDSYQVKGWNGDVFFGPKDWTQFLELNKQDQKEHDHDEDSKCRKFRELIPYGWYVDQEHYLRRQLKKIISNDDDINLVNTYSLPPGGYVFPHRDYAIDGMGLAKIYVALKWGKGNVFGMYGCGDIPIKEGDVFLINNYTLPHWVYNGSDKDRVVIDISANLHSPVIKDKIIQAFKRSFVH
jgi:hypothetical protein